MDITKLKKMGGNPISEGLKNEIEEIKTIYTKNLSLAKKKLAALKDQILPSNLFVEVTLLKAKIATFEGKNKDAQIWLDKLVNITWDTFDETLKADYFLIQAQTLIYLGKQESGLENARKALEIYAKHQKKEKMSSTFIVFGNVYYSNTQYDLALENYQKGLEYAISKNSPQYLRSLASIGNIYFARGQLYKSAEYMEQALELANELDDLRMSTLISLNSGLNAFLLGEFKKSLQILNQGLESAHKLGNGLYIILLKNMKALYWMELGELENAEDLLRDIEKNKEELSFPHARLEFDLAKAKLLIMQGKFQTTYDLLKKTVKFAKEFNRKINSIEILCLFAEVAHSLGHTEESYNSILQANELALNDQSDIDRARILTSRSKINLLNNSFDEAKIQILEVLWLTQKTHAIELEYQAQFVLVQILIEKVNSTHNKFILKEIEAKIEDALLFTSKNGLIPFQIQSLTLLGLLQVSQNFYSAAFTTWKKGLELAQKVKMSNYITKITEYLKFLPVNFTSEETDMDCNSEIDNSLIKAMKNRIFGARTSLNDYAYSLLRDQIFHVTKTLTQNRISQEDLDKIFMVCYKMDDTFGPTTHICSSSEIINEGWTNKLQNIASIYYLTIGQGSNYHCGLFGPLPFIESEQRSLVYANFLGDSGLKDPRMQQKNYLLLTIVFPARLSPIFYDQQKITSEFETFFLNFKNIQDLNETRLKEFQLRLLNSLLPSDLKEN